jgi:hypothetical protein
MDIFFREFSVLRNSRNSAGTSKLFRLFRLPRNNFFVGNCQPYLGLVSVVCVPCCLPPPLAAAQVATAAMCWLPLLPGLLRCPEERIGCRHLFVGQPAVKGGEGVCPNAQRLHAYRPCPPQREEPPAPWATC